VFAWAELAIPGQEAPLLTLYDRLAGAKAKTVGTKQTLKALQRGLARSVYIARDADDHVVRELLRACRDKDVEVVYADSMAKLGQACGIQVGAASAAVLEE
jgi:large subunit ribosomal protein L7A